MLPSEFQIFSLQATDEKTSPGDRRLAPRHELLILCIVGLTFFCNAAWGAKPSAPAAPRASAQPRYFFMIDLDPKYQFVGLGELTEDQAAKANAYRFTYLLNGKLKEIDYLRAGAPMPDPLFGVAGIAIEHQAGVERRWYHDAQGQSVKDVDGNCRRGAVTQSGGISDRCCQSGRDGARARDSSGVLHYVRTLDEHNRLIRGRRIGLFGNAVTDDNGFL